LGAIAQESDVKSILVVLAFLSRDISKSTDISKSKSRCSISSRHTNSPRLSDSLPQSNSFRFDRRDVSDGESAEKEHPYLLLFTFSPVKNLLKHRASF
jgi:hypothetical protein